MSAALSQLHPRSGEIAPNGVYTRKRLAEVLGVSQRTLARMEDSGELPPSFALRRRSERSPRAWTGNALLVHFARQQREAIQTMQEAGAT